MNKEIINQMKMIFELMGSDEFTGSGMGSVYERVEREV